MASDRMHRWRALVHCVWVMCGALGCDVGGEMRILDVQPKAGHTQGDQPVKILGENLRQDIGYSVYFGTRKSQQVTILDPETLLVSTPTSNQEGVVDIMIRADNGDAWRIKEGFTFEDMGGNVMQRVGDTPASKGDKGNLAY